MVPRVGCCTRLYTRPSEFVFVTSSSTSSTGLSPSSLSRRVTVSPAIGSATLIVAAVDLEPLLSSRWLSKDQSSRIASPCQLIPSCCSAFDAGPHRSQQMKCRLLTGLASGRPAGQTLRMKPPCSATVTEIAPFSSVTVSSTESVLDAACAVASRLVRIRASLRRP